VVDRDVQYLKKPVECEVLSVYGEEVMRPTRLGVFRIKGRKEREDVIELGDAKIDDIINDYKKFCENCKIIAKEYIVPELVYFLTRKGIKINDAIRIVNNIIGVDGE
jgi:hypothetical protein